MASLIAGMIVLVGAGGKIEHYAWVGYLSIAIVFACVFIAKMIHTTKAEVPSMQQPVDRVA